MRELWGLSATEMARRVRGGELSAREIVEGCLARIESTNPRLNALVETDAKAARQAADATDRALASGEPVGRLAGVPVAIKANTDQAGAATTNGVPAWADQIRDRDAPHVARLRAAGATLLGRSNTPAFSMRWCAENDLHGRTLNPWSPERTPGGSTGGGAAAVAAGMVALAQGGDYGGSIRYPAHACGIAGIRPTIGRVPHAPSGEAGAHLSWRLMATEGLLARTVEDLRLALAVSTGLDARDPFAVPLADRAPEPAGPRRVGLVADPGVVAPSPAVSAGLRTAAAALQDAGYVVEEIELGLLAEAYRLWYLLTIQDNRRDLAVIRELGGDGATRSFQTQLAVARQWFSPEPDLEEVLDGYDRRDRLIRRLGEVLDELPLLLTPVSAEPPFTHGEDIESDATAIRLAAANWPCMALPCLDAPGLSVPVAVTDGLPVGVQLVSARFREDLLFDAGEAIQARVGTFRPWSDGSA